MAVPTTINDLSVTASSNGPAGTESPNTLDDYIRAQGAILRKLYNDVNDGTLQAYNATRIAGTTPTAAGLALIDDADAAAQRTTLGLGTAATASSSSFATSGAVTGNGNTMNTARILGRTTAGTGAIEEISISGGTLSGGVLTLGGITLGTSVASTSGTSIDFTGIPATAKRITVMLSGVSTNGTSLVQVQIGAGSIQASGYAGGIMSMTTGLSGATLSAGFAIQCSGAADVRHGHLVLTHMGSNIWVASGVFGNQVSSQTMLLGGSVTLSGALDRVRLTTVSGTDTFDAGSVNIMYE